MKAFLHLVVVCAAVLFQSAPLAVAAGDKPAGPVQVTVKCDKAEYMHGEPGARYIMAPTGKLSATLTIKNISDAEQKLGFSSGQVYDFVIRDAKGAEVKRWSEGMMFPQVMGDMKLEPGQELSYKAVLELGKAGKPLPHGDYTLEGIATCAGPITSAPVPFKIIPTPDK